MYDVQGVSVSGGAGGWVGVGQTLEDGPPRRVMVRRTDKEGATLWTYFNGPAHVNTSAQALRKHT